MNEGIMGMGRKKDANTLLSEALAAFESAQDKVESAIRSIDAQAAEAQKKIDDLQFTIDNAASVRERLDRVGTRIQEFVS